mmetsp:Transcript_8905/g.12085  ORF Transcript_8905/g.12085 Transcript_8905/m.12085 type:complete len:671 (+) Transcript_8905:3-2015(+)
MMLVRRSQALKQFHVPGGRISAFLNNVVNLKSFENIVNFLIVSNFFTMMLEHYKQSKQLTDLMDKFAAAFRVVFTLEAVMKMWGLGLGGYFYSNWNTLDLGLVVVTSCEWVKGIEGLGWVRLLRLARIFRVMFNIQGIGTIFKAIADSSSQLLSVVSVMMLILFMYAVVGVSLFGKVMHQDFIDPHANFEAFPAAMSTLLRCATGESYNGIMHDLTVSEPDCHPDECGSWVAVPYMVSFVVLATLIMLNIVLAVVINAYTRNLHEDSCPVNSMVIEAFQTHWSRWDTSGSGFIELQDIIALLTEMPEEIGFRRGRAQLRIAEVLPLASKLQLPIYILERISTPPATSSSAFASSPFGNANADTNNDTNPVFIDDAIDDANFNTDAKTVANTSANAGVTRSTKSNATYMSNSIASNSWPPHYGFNLAPLQIMSGKFSGIFHFDKEKHPHEKKMRRKLSLRSNIGRAFSPRAQQRVSMSLKYSAKQQNLVYCISYMDLLESLAYARGTSNWYTDQEFKEWAWGDITLRRTKRLVELNKISSIARLKVPLSRLSSLASMQDLRQTLFTIADSRQLSISTIYKDICSFVDKHMRVQTTRYLYYNMTNVTPQEYIAGVLIAAHVRGWLVRRKLRETFVSGSETSEEMQDNVVNRSSSGKALAKLQTIFSRTIGTG